MHTLCDSDLVGGSTVTADQEGLNMHSELGGGSKVTADQQVLSMHSEPQSLPAGSPKVVQREQHRSLRLGPSLLGSRRCPAALTPHSPSRSQAALAPAHLRHWLDGSPTHMHAVRALIRRPGRVRHIGSGAVALPLPVLPRRHVRDLGL